MTAPREADYEYRPRALAADDFLGQVNRTVGGQPVGAEQIELLVAAVRAGLQLSSDDVLLDLACGNGAITRYLYDECSAVLGVDMSQYLISVAKANFEQPPRFTYLQAEGSAYVRAEPEPGRFTKVLCYGSLQYFSFEACETVLSALRERFTRVERVFIGNLPDRERAASFYGGVRPSDATLDDHTEEPGRWLSQRQLRELAASAGWRAEFSLMPAEFFGSSYRYDALLTPAR